MVEMKKIIQRVNILFWIIFLLVCCGKKEVKVYAYGESENISVDSFLDTSEFEEMQEILDENLGEKSFSFVGFVKKICSGEVEWSLSGILNECVKTIATVLKNNKTMWVQCFTIVIVGSICTSFSGIFKNGQVGETGFFMTYLMLFSVLFGAFLSIFQLVKSSVELLLLFMKALLPVYFLMVAGSKGAGVATPMYQSSLWIIGILEVIIEKIILPVMEIYFVLGIINHFSKEDKLSKLVEFLESVIKWSLKGILGITLGLHTVESMMLPAVNQVKQNIVLKTGKAIPVLGDTFESVSETFFSIASLLKNAVGISGIVCIILLCTAPVLKLLVYTVVFKLGTAILQPVSEKRIWNCLNGISNTAGLLLYLEVICILLFSITIIIVAKGTG